MIFLTFFCGKLLNIGLILFYFKNLYILISHQKFCVIINPFNTYIILACHLGTHRRKYNSLPNPRKLLNNKEISCPIKEAQRLLYYIIRTDGCFLIFRSNFQTVHFYKPNLSIELVRIIRRATAFINFIGEN